MEEQRNGSKGERGRGEGRGGGGRKEIAKNIGKCRSWGGGKGGGKMQGKGEGTKDEDGRRSKSKQEQEEVNGGQQRQQNICRLASREGVACRRFGNGGLGEKREI
jgi:hypothetical protein